MRIKETKAIELKDGKALLPRLIVVSLLVIGILLISFSAFSHAGISIMSMFQWVEHPVSAYKFTTYDDLLHSYVKGDLIDYQSLSKSGKLNKAVEELGHVSPDRMANAKDQLTFWINAYNLLVLKAIADRYPVKSIRHLGNTFHFHKFIVGGKTLSIEEIYTDRIVPAAKKQCPLSIFLASGGARGYPPLMEHATDAIRLNSDANLAFYKFIRNPNNVSFNEDLRVFSLSPFFQWTFDVFDKDYESPHHLVNIYLDEKDNVDVDNPTIIKTYKSAFDWRLNDTALKVR